MELAMRKFSALVAIAVLIVLVLIGLLADRQSVAQGPAAQWPVPRWEFKTIRTSPAAEEAGQGAINRWARTEGSYVRQRNRSVADSI
jgi:hypothetical protein